ncbi:MAG: hypothetical protein ACO23O_13345, partial [Ilumatobacteraceae bacterium]
PTSSTSTGPPATAPPRHTGGRPDTDESETVTPRRRRTAEVDDPAVGLPDETVRGGRPEEPGRVYRVRSMPR